MRRYALRPLAGLVGWAIAGGFLCLALLGCLRFLLLAGASPRYLAERKRWYEAKMVGRRLGAGDLLAFGLWVAQESRPRRWAR